MSLLTFPTLLIYGLLYGGPALRKLGEPFSWRTHLLRGTVKRCFSVAHHLGGVGNLWVSDFSSLWILSPTCKVSYINKLVCVAFTGKKVRWKRRCKYAFCELLLLGENERNETKISQTLVREGICRRSVSLFLWFMGVFWWWVSNKKKWCYDFWSRERACLLVLRGASVHFSETLPEKV